jgi:hypothetical protein
MCPQRDRTGHLIPCAFPNWILLSAPFIYNENTNISLLTRFPAFIPEQIRISRAALVECQHNTSRDAAQRTCFVMYCRTEDRVRTAIRIPIVPRLCFCECYMPPRMMTGSLLRIHNWITKTWFPWEPSNGAPATHLESYPKGFQRISFESLIS